MRHPIVAEDLREIERRVGAAFDALEGRSLVITGAAGLLMTYLTETVAWLNESRFRRPCRLTAVVRRRVAEDSPLGHLLRAPGVAFRVHDARTAPDDLSEADYMVLAACKGSPRHYLADPIGTLELNGGGLGHWLELAARLGSRSVLYVSSGEAYGDPEPDAIPTPETYVGRTDATSPRGVYAEAKRYGEALALAYHRSRGVPAAIVRPFQVFGPGIREGDGRALPDFLVAAARGAILRPVSAGTARRTFLYIADAAVAFWLVLLRSRPGTVYNVGTPAPEISIRELAETIARLAGPPCRVEWPDAPPPSDAPRRSAADITRLQDDFGFRPEHGLESLLQRTLAWLRDQPVAP